MEYSTASLETHVHKSENVLAELSRRKRKEQKTHSKGNHTHTHTHTYTHTHTHTHTLSVLHMSGKGSFICTKGVCGPEAKYNP